MPRKKSKRNMSQVVIFSGIWLLQKISPYFAGLLSFKLWLYPGRGILKRISPYKQDTAKADTILVANKKVCFWSAGTGPVILLAHGWASFSGHLSFLADGLLEQGYKVVWFDAPAHGASTGSQTNLYEVVECITKLESVTGPFKAVIGHSFGALCTLKATYNGLNPEKIIAISSPSSAMDQAYKFFKILKIEPKTQKYFFAHLYKLFDENEFKAVDTKVFGKNIRQSVLIIHDKNDKIVTLDEVKTLDESLAHSKLILTTGLGHNKILYSPKVLRYCLDFIRDDIS